MAIASRTADGQVVVSPTGRVDVDHAADLYDELVRLAGERGVRAVAVDLAHTDALDSAGVIVMTMGRRMIEAAGKSFRIDNPSAEHQAALALVPAAPPALRAPPRRPPGLVERVGLAGFQVWDTLSALVAMIADTIAAAVRCLTRRERLPAGSVVEQSVAIGVDALPIVALLSWLLGVILAYQGIYQLRRFGADVYVADIVSISMVREFGPLLAAIILAGRSGSAIAAELGTMVLREEVAALETMGIRPARYLVLPRIIAITVTGPALAMMATALGVVGGAMMASLARVPSGIFWARVADALVLDDFAVGTIKAVLFAWIVGFAGVLAGLRTRGAAHSVGQSTTRAVVASIFFIIVADSIITTITTSSSAS
jgi:phospholipid/cholesterol/gamma-HCH transport system permease protein